jgi:diguanylate cyclase (GGDEF)-like protein
MSTSGDNKSKKRANKEEISSVKRPAKILIVDDEEFVRDLFRDVLEDEEYEIMTACDGKEALGKIKKQTFDMIISDISMPGMDGLELLQKTKEMDPDIEVIIITGYASVETAIKAMRLGAADYLAKPLNIDLIKIIVAKTLEKSQLERVAKKAQYYKELSRLDSMTGLFNHQTLHHLLEAEVARAQRHGHNVSLLMLDIDKFKKYNDTYGHPAGDILLKELANLLRRSCRFYDLIARYGGEEFSIIAPETSKAETILLGNRLTDIIEKTEFPGSGSLNKAHITISIGIATYPEDAPNKEELIMKADQALYQAKSSGRNKTCAA